MAHLTHTAVNLLLIIAIVTQPMVALSGQIACGSRKNAAAKCSGCGCCEVQSADDRCGCCGGMNASTENGRVSTGGKKRTEAENSSDSSTDCCGRPKLSSLPETGRPAVDVVRSETPQKTSCGGGREQVTLEGKLSTDRPNHANSGIGPNTTLAMVACGCVQKTEPLSESTPRAPLRNLREVRSLIQFVYADTESSVGPSCRFVLKQFSARLSPNHFSQIEFCVWRI